MNHTAIAITLLAGVLAGPAYGQTRYSCNVSAERMQDLQQVLIPYHDTADGVRRTWAEIAAFATDTCRFYADRYGVSFFSSGDRRASDYTYDTARDAIGLCAALGKSCARDDAMLLALKLLKARNQKDRIEAQRVWRIEDELKGKAPTARPKTSQVSR